MDYRVVAHCFEGLATGLMIYQNCYGSYYDFSVSLQPQPVVLVALVVVHRLGAVTGSHCWNY